MDEEDINRIEAWKFVFSPAGLATMAIPLFMVIIIACYISNVRKKIRVGSRGGRYMTR
jgi:hypothetical protein